MWQGLEGLMLQQLDLRYLRYSSGNGELVIRLTKNLHVVG